MYHIYQVHPFHVSGEALLREGYHSRYPNELYTYRELAVFNKYTAWPPFFASPACNLFNPSRGMSCQLSSHSPVIE